VSTNDTPPATPVTWQSLEVFARHEVQGFVQRILEEEVIVATYRPLVVCIAR